MAESDRPIKEKTKRQASAAGRAVAQMKVGDTKYQLVDPKNGDVALLWHRGEPLSDKETASAKHLCLFRVVKSHRAYTGAASGKKKKRKTGSQESQHHHIFTTRSYDADSRTNKYKGLTKAQFKSIFGLEVPKDHKDKILTLSSGESIPMYGSDVRKQMREYQAAADARKKKRASSKIVDDDAPEKKKKKKKKKSQSGLSAEMKAKIASAVVGMLE